MTPDSPNPFDPLLLETNGVIRGTPSWKDVKEAMARLEPLRKPAAKPYDQMDLDRERVLGYAVKLQNSANSIAYAICLASHLARFSKTPAFEQRLSEAFRALSTGLDLPGLSEAETQTELDRCVRATFPNLTIELPPLLATAPAAEAPPPPPAPSEGTPQAASVPIDAPAVAADATPNGTVTGSAVDSGNSPSEEVPQSKSASEIASPSSSPTPESAPPPEPASNTWGGAVERALTAIRSMGPVNFDEVIQRASSTWQNRLVAFLTGQPEVPPDIDYLRCRVSNSPLGMALHPRLKNVGIHEWAKAYLAGMLETGVPFPVPLWFSLAALGVLGFDVPQELSTVKSAEENKAAAEFVSKIPQTSSPPKGLLILRVTAESQTTSWKMSPTMPALILTPTEFLSEGKINLQSYFQARLHGVLIEVGRDEQAIAALNRVGITAINHKLPSVRVGLLVASPLQTLPAGISSTAVMPVDAYDAYQKAFGSQTSVSRSASAV